MTEIDISFSKLSVYDKLGSTIKREIIHCFKDNQIHLSSSTNQKINKAIIDLKTARRLKIISMIQNRLGATAKDVYAIQKENPSNSSTRFSTVEDHSEVIDAHRLQNIIDPVYYASKPLGSKHYDKSWKVKFTCQEKINLAVDIFEDFENLLYKAVSVAIRDVLAKSSKSYDERVEIINKVNERIVQVVNRFNGNEVVGEISIHITVSTKGENDDLCTTQDIADDDNFSFALGAIGNELKSSLIGLGWKNPNIGIELIN